MPRPAHNTLASFAAALVLATAGCASRASDEEEHSALIGGEEVSVESLPSIVDVARVPRDGLPATAKPLPGGCTAARVGRRTLLLAAHCVLNPATISPIWNKGESIALLRDLTRGWTEAHVDHVDIHPAWLTECDRTYCAASVVTAKMDAPDVAVIVLDKDLDGISIAAIDEEPLSIKDEVVVTGFGCTVGVNVADARERVTLRARLTHTVPVDAAVHSGSPLDGTSSQLQIASGNYTFTLGPAANGAMAGLCPGDSGGPLYRKRGDALVVVGVNSNYTLDDAGPGDIGLPVTNWHTRLDGKSRHDVAGWLRRVVTDAQ